MASTVFEVHVKWPNKPVKVMPATIGGGNEVTAEWLAEHYQRTNAFPGAEKVTVHEVEGKLNTRRMIETAAQLRGAPIVKPKPVKTTPKVEVGEVVGAEKTEVASGSIQGRSQQQSPGGNPA